MFKKFLPLALLSILVIPTEAQVSHGGPSGGPIRATSVPTTIQVNGTPCVLGGSCTPSSSTSSIAVGSTTITGGTDTNVLFDNAGILGEVAKSTSATISALAQRDANGNLFSNNSLQNGTITASAAGTTVLTAASSRYQALTGSTTQTYQLPDATTLSLGPWFVFNNNSSASLSVVNAGSGAIFTVAPGGVAQCGPTSISTANGTWDCHAYVPSSASWGTGVTGLQMNNVLSTTPQIAAGASSATSPAFIPQRGSSTTGFSGDSTHVYGVIGGTARLTVDATGLSTTGEITGSAGTMSTVGTAAIGQIPGTATNDNAAAGNVGEFVDSTNATPASLLNNNPTNITTISLAAGDWDVNGTVYFNGAAGTLVTGLLSGISLTPGGIPATGTTARTDLGLTGAAQFATQGVSVNVGSTRISLSGTTTVYLVGLAQFSVSTATAIGEISARRVR